ncbi:MAG: AhpC/TSA family protein [Cyclobacteriaceae bacterium]|nr:AhpC/TSA family protein [Cyclobacteriaceae bacterium]
MKTASLINQFILAVWFILFISYVPTAIAQDAQKKLKEAKGLNIGDVIDNFQATDQYGKTFDLYHKLQEGPLVIVFYRGQWCPVCNRHLSILQDSLQFIFAHGAGLIAVSPEKTEYLEMTAKITHAEYPLLHDNGYKISKTFDVAFVPNKATSTMYNSALKADLKNAHSDKTQQLPIPATYILSKEGKIVWRHFNPDYKQRAPVSALLDALDQLK